MENVQNRRIWSDIPAFFAEAPLPRGGETAILDEGERRHARALRLRPGDRAMLLDGAGGRAFGRIGEDPEGRTIVRVEESLLEEPDAGVYIGLAIGLLDDRSRCEFLWEKSVELGVGAVYPFASERAEGRFRRERLERIGPAALKQSQRAWLPRLHDPVDLDRLIAVAAGYDRVLVCHEVHHPDQQLGRRLPTLLERTDPNRPPRLLVVVGPEGGLRRDEVDRLCNDADAEIVGLGDSRLRAETAAIVAVGVIGGST